jgi:hypothetical protein
MKVTKINLQRKFLIRFHPLNQRKSAFYSLGK